jgi:hypothetical protein
MFNALRAYSSDGIAPSKRIPQSTFAIADDFHLCRPERAAATTSGLSDDRIVDIPP